MDHPCSDASNKPIQGRALRSAHVLGRGVAVCILVLLLVPARGRSSGPQSGCGTNPFQDWYLVDGNIPFVTLTGTISGTIKHNVGDWWDDGDWNILVDPDDNSLLVNSHGDANENGLIELEVNSRGEPGDLATRFPSGTRIMAYGEWVEDTGHDDKTELHPLYWMQTINTNPVSIFVAQDDTGRFVDAQNLLWATDLEFPLTAQYPKVTPWTIPPSHTQVFEENGRIARGTSDASVGPGGYFPAAYLNGWWFSDCESVGRVIYGDSPNYSSTIQRTTASLLRETVTYSVSTEVGTGQKIAMLKVTAELDSPPQGALAYTSWWYESSAGVPGPVSLIRHQPPHRVEFSMPYAPALGYVQNSWRLIVSGWIQSVGPLTSTEFEQPVRRTGVTEGRTYVLDKSRISLDKQVKGTGPCGDAAYLTVNDSALLPQIALRSLRWTLRIQRDSDGFAVTNPVETLVTANSPVDDPGFSAMTYNAPNDKRLDVVWKQLSPGQPNLVQVVVTARSVTELGEEIVATESLSPLCGLQLFSYSQVLDYSYRLMARRGFKGEFYELVKKMRGSDRRWLEALAKFANGERLTVDERRLILSRATEGSRLPALPKKPKLKPIMR